MCIIGVIRLSDLGFCGLVRLVGFATFRGKLFLNGCVLNVCVPFFFPGSACPQEEKHTFFYPFLLLPNS